MTPEVKQKLNTKVTINIKAVKLSKFAEWVKKKSGLKVKVVAPDMTLVGERHVKSPLITIIKSTLGKHGLSCGYSKKSGLVFYKKENKSPQKANKAAKSPRKESKVAKSPQKENKVAKSPQKANKAAKSPQKEITEVRLLSPENGAKIYQLHPHFHWNRLVPDHIEDAYQIQILGENKKVVDDDTFEVISRYVPLKAIPPGKYSWRVRKAPDGAWSKERNFELKVPEVYKIAAGSEPMQIQKTVLEASRNTPAQVVFEPGEYTWGNTLKLKKVNDLTIDGGGATILFNQSNDKLKGAFLHFLDCANITVRNMKLREYKNPSIMLDVLAVDKAAKTVKVKPKEGERTDLHNVFPSGPKSHAILRFPNLKIPGKSSGEIRIGDPKLKLTGPDAGGVFTLHNVTRNIKEGMIGTLLKYSTRAFNLTGCTNLTFVHLDLLGTGAAVIGGRNNSALSLLSCRFLPYKPGGLLGAQSYITGGEIGMWIENIEISLTPDDNMACISARSKLKEITPEGIVSGGLSTIKPGDQVLLWDEKVGEPTVVTITEVWGKNGKKVPTGLMDDRRVYTAKFDKTAAQINSAMKRPKDASFKGVMIFRYNPNNSDFVYRNNKILGGSAGMMYHGNRGLIEGNEIINCRGVGLQASHQSPNEAAGFGSRNVVIKNNTIKNTGKVAIKSISTANIGGNLIIKNNHLIYTLESGSIWNMIQVSGARDKVVIKDNTFESELKPEKKAGGTSWIRVDNSGEIELKDNKVLGEFTKVQMMRRRD